MESVGSTNNYAMDLIKKGLAQSGNAILAREQTEGKGRRMKRWSSAYDQNILLTIMVQMQWQPVSHQFPLSMAVALACADFVESYIPNIAAIKWPNDIYFNDSKAAGILIENQISGTNWQWAVIGIGVNVNQTDFDEVDKSVTSMKMMTGKDYAVLKLSNELYSHVLSRINGIHQGKGSLYLQQYNDQLYGKNRVANFSKNGRVFQALIIGVNEIGQLEAMVDGTLQLFNFDEITFAGFSEKK